MKYLIDTNVFIEAHRMRYPFDLFPSFWEWLAAKFDNGEIYSTDLVLQEIMNGGDSLATWVKQKKNDNWFISESADDSQHEFINIANNVMKANFKDKAKQDFLAVADPWLISVAAVNNMTLVTQEKSNPARTNKIFIPDICNLYKVPYIDTLGMIRELKGKF